MNDFGVQFAVHDERAFGALQVLFGELKKDKDAEQFRSPDGWVEHVPDSVKCHFDWPSAEDRQAWVERRSHTPIMIGKPEEQIGSTWDFYRVFESVEDGDYALLSCEKTGANTGVILIDPYGYPYGGLGPLIALVEAFGFRVLGVNEYGEYQSREELLGNEGTA